MLLHTPSALHQTHFPTGQQHASMQVPQTFAPHWRVQESNRFRISPLRAIALDVFLSDKYDELWLGLGITDPAHSSPMVRLWTHCLASLLHSRRSGSSGSHSLRSAATNSWVTVRARSSLGVSPILHLVIVCFLTLQCHSAMAFPKPFPKSFPPLPLSFPLPIPLLKPLYYLPLLLHQAWLTSIMHLTVLRSMWQSCASLLGLVTQKVRTSGDTSMPRCAERSCACGGPCTASTLIALPLPFKGCAAGAVDPRCLATGLIGRVQACSASREPQMLRPGFAVPCGASVSELDGANFTL